MNEDIASAAARKIELALIYENWQEAKTILRNVMNECVLNKNRRTPAQRMRFTFFEIPQVESRTATLLAKAGWDNVGEFVRAHPNGAPRVRHMSLSSWQRLSEALHAVGIRWSHLP